MGEKFGLVSHETELITDSADHPSYVLRTSAIGLPALRVEEVSHPNEPLIQGLVRSARLEFKVIAAGTADEKPFDLDRINLESTTPVEWVSSVEGIGDDGGFPEFARRFAVSIDSAGLAGDRRIEVLIRQGNEVLLRHPVVWEVVNPIMISPKVVVLKQDGVGVKVSIRSRDGKSFVIKSIESEDPALRVLWSTEAQSAAHVVQVQPLTATPSKKRGLLLVVTDHAAQPRVELPYHILD